MIESHVPPHHLLSVRADEGEDAKPTFVVRDRRSMVEVMFEPGQCPMQGRNDR